MRTLETIIADMTALVREVHELGSAEGAAKLRAELTAILIPHHSGEASLAPKTIEGTFTPTASVTAELKARMGTVKPTIIRLINETPSGLTQDEIIEKTQFKSNSVRGTLYAIQKEGIVVRRSGRYFRKPSDEPSVMDNLGNTKMNDEGSNAGASEPS